MEQQDTNRIYIGSYDSRKQEPDTGIVTPEIIQISDDTLSRDQIVANTRQDFDYSRRNRRWLELQWQLNMCFYAGDQFRNILPNYNYMISAINDDAEIRQIYNKIAPAANVRFAKLARVQPMVKTRPASSDQEDISTSRICTKIMHYVYQNNKYDKIKRRATEWSELCGTSFYKNIWNPDKGKVLGSLPYEYTSKQVKKMNNSQLCACAFDIGIHAASGSTNHDLKKAIIQQISQPEVVREGDVEVIAVKCFEIYPDNNSYEELDDCRYIIHAKAVDANIVREVYNVDVTGKDINILTMDNTSSVSTTYGSRNAINGYNDSIKENQVVVIEKYEKPTRRYPNGRLIIIANDKLISYTTLPYVNRADDRRCYPFSRQVCEIMPNSFWGVSWIERCVPMQRVYNDVKNAIHEHAQRATIGAWQAEDGSIIDPDDLEATGIYPGKIVYIEPNSKGLVPLQESTLPNSLQNIPVDLDEEIITSAGVSELSVKGSTSTEMSGIALEILKEQDDTRLSYVATNIRDAAIENGMQWLFLYKQFTKIYRVSRIIDENDTADIFYWDASDITTMDVIPETENELMITPSQRKQMTLELYTGGFYANAEGITPDHVKASIARALTGQDELIQTGIDVDINTATAINQIIVQNCCCFSNTSIGIRFDTVTSSVIKNCVSSSNGTDGISLNLPNDIEVLENVCSNNTDDGINITNGSAEDCSIQGNVLVLNGGDNYQEGIGAGPHTVLSNFALHGTQADNYAVNGTTMNKSIIDQGTGTFGTYPGKWRNISMTT